MTVLNQIGNYWRIKGNTQLAIECFRKALLGAGDFHSGDLFYSGVCAAVALGVGLLAFTRVERNFMDTV